MSAVRILRTAARRWYLTTAGLLLTGALLGLVFAVFPVQYQSMASVLLVPPIQKTGENPYLALSGMNEVTDVLSRSMMSDTTKTQLESSGFRGKYEVYKDVLASGPILVVYGESDSPSVAKADRDLVLELMDVRLAEIQGQVNIPTRSRITTKTITADEKPKLQWRTPLRLGIAIAGAGCFASLGLAVGAEAFLSRRRARTASGKSRQADDPRDGDAESFADDQVPDWGWEAPEDARGLDQAYTANGDHSDGADRFPLATPKG